MNLPDLKRHQQNVCGVIRSRKLWVVTTPSGRALYDSVSNGRSHSWFCLHSSDPAWNKGSPAPLDTWTKEKKSRGFGTIPVVWEECSDARRYAIVNTRGIIQWESVAPSRRRAWGKFMLNRACDGRLEKAYWYKTQDCDSIAKWAGLKESQGYYSIAVRLTQVP